MLHSTIVAAQLVLSGWDRDHSSLPEKRRTATTVKFQTVDTEHEGEGGKQKEPMARASVLPVLTGETLLPLTVEP